MIYTVKFSVNLVVNVVTNTIMSQSVASNSFIVCRHLNTIIMQITIIHQFGFELVIRPYPLVNQRLIMTVT